MIAHGIDATGRLISGEFVDCDGQWELRLSDGTNRLFGPVTTYSEDALRRIGDGVRPEQTTIPRTAATRALASASSVIVEVTPFCTTGCHTCIASSVSTRAGELSTEEIRSRLTELHRDTRVPAGCQIMVSGGEPTEHPEFFKVVSSPEFLSLRSRFVITHGLKFTDPAFAARFAEESPGTQLYLQYDSFDPNHLRQIRGSDFSSIRLAAINNCEVVGIDYTLVCVVFRNVNDVVALEIVERTLGSPRCVGVTFQPIKFVGRNAAATHEHRLTTFDLVSRFEDELQKELGIRLIPHPANPVNWAIGYEDGRTPVATTLYEEGRTKRVAVIWHTDVENYILESVGRYPIAFAEPGRIMPLEVHYDAI